MNFCSQNTMRPLSFSWFGFWLPVLCSLPAAAGESQMTGPPHSVVALVGDDVILPCHLVPEMDVTAELLEWTRSDLKRQLVHVMRDGRFLEFAQNPIYKSRTLMFTEGMKRGNISMKLFNVQLSDRGTYTCDVPLWNKQSSVQLVVFPEAVSSPATITAWMDRDGGGVVLHCESGGWYPEPELLWLDAEGHLLSAGPPETVRGPDDLYTVSSRLTVEKRHSNSFTCRVQQKTTIQTRDTHFTVPEDLFKHRDSSVSTIIGLAVCILLLLLLLFFVWRWRQNITKNKTQHSAVTTEGGTDHPSNANRPEDQSVTEERETLMAGGTSQIQELKDNRQKKSKHNKKDQKKKNETELQNLKEEKKKNETELQNLKEEKKKNETELQNLKEEKKKNETELQNLKEEKKKNETELQNLKEEKKKNETELQNLKEELENKNKELDRLTNTRGGNSWSFWGWSLQGQKTENLKEAERQLEIKKTENSQLQRNWETKFNEETTKRKEAERQVDSLRKEAERQVDSLRKEPSTKACNIQDVPHQEASSSANQNSTPASGIVIELNDQGQYIRLRNTSHQEQHLGGCRLEMKINGKDISFIFEKSSKLKSGETVTMSGPGCRNRQLTPDLWWNDLKPFRPADKLKFTLINVHTDIRHELRSSVVEH